MKIWRRPGPNGIFLAKKTVTFTGAAGAGAVGTVAVFTVTGVVFVESIAGYCTVDLTEAGATATIVGGIPNNTDAFFASPTGGATDIDAGDFWGPSSGTTVPDEMAVSVSTGPTTAQSNRYLAANVILTIGGQNVTGGSIDFYMLYRPISAGSSVVAA